MSKELVKFSPSKEIKNIAENAGIHMETARVHTVNSISTYQAVDSYLGDVVSDLKKIESYKELAIRDIKDELDVRTNYFNPIIKQLQVAKKDLLSKQQKWNKRQEEVARAAQIEADKAAAKLAREAHVAALEATKDESPEVQALAVQEAAEMDIAAPVILAATPKGRTKYRDHWVMECDDFDAVVRYIADHHKGTIELDGILMLDESKLKGIAKSIKKEGHFIPGLRIVNNRIPIS